MRDGDSIKFWLDEWTKEESGSGFSLDEIIRVKHEYMKEVNS